MTGAAFHRGESKQDYETDPTFIERVKERFGGIDWDLAANSDNTQAGTAAFVEGECDALEEDWNCVGFKGMNLWLNPPYDDIKTWAKKCSQTLPDRKVLFLTPASVGSNWFADLVVPFARVYILNGRLTFVGEKHPFPKDCMLSVYGEPPGFELWRWKR